MIPLRFGAGEGKKYTTEVLMEYMEYIPENRRHLFYIYKSPGANPKAYIFDHLSLKLYGVEKYP